MDFVDKINEIVNRIPKQLDYIKTEEATKNAFVMPFIAALGYDIFNPMEVVPEFTTDIGIKKGEKVDYAICKDNKVIVLIECKWCGANLEKEHASQLYRYFSVSEARFGILTNGIIYYFYSDIDEPNKMDPKPFFIFNLLDFDDKHIFELKKFTKSSFELDNILATASELKYTGAIKRIIIDEMSSCTDDFVRFFASRVYSGRLTQIVLEQFRNIVKEAFNQFIRERVNDRLKSALDADHEEQAEIVEEIERSEIVDKGIITTEEELEGYYIVKAIVREIVDVSRIMMRDTKSYCGILLDDNNRKPICRLHFNYSQKHLGLFSSKNEERVPINRVDEIYQYADRIKAVINEYEMSSSP
ncbi:MAG: type I restriction enzyme HsdR N-terminal domain-containing protein [Proteobacteria bacterium]|nr:type I restriction enzyme HsdR N-terminal domain-containing protein [Pseudomonadota bacterium]